MTAFLTALFAGVILALAMSGIYGVVSYQVTQQTRELGIRITLGAGRHQIFRLVNGSCQSGAGPSRGSRDTDSDWHLHLLLF